MTLADIATALPGDWTRTLLLDADAQVLHTGLFTNGDATLVRQRVAEVRPEGPVLDCTAVETRLHLFRAVDGDVVRQTQEQAALERVAAVSPELCPMMVDGHIMVAGRTYREVTEP